MKTLNQLTEINKTFSREEAQKAQKLKWWQRARWPYLDLWFDCWLLRLETHLMSYDYNSMTLRWVVLHVKVCNRWGFRVKLYSPERHFHAGEYN